VLGASVGNWFFLGDKLMFSPNGRKRLLSSCVVGLVAVLGTGLARVAAKSATEAPAGARASFSRIEPEEKGH